MRRIIDLLILLVVLLVGVLAVKHAQPIGDWVHSLTYTPTAEVAQLAEESGMSEAGQRLFYRFEPQVVDQPTLSKTCDIERLGCAAGRHIYILKATSRAEYNRNIVTAAHEMLHVAYDRLSDTERAGLEPLLDAELKRPEARKIAAALDNYPGEDYYNEAHSYIGSQLGGLSQALERHYDGYFSDRRKAVQAYQDSPEYSFRHLPAGPHLIIL